MLYLSLLFFIICSLILIAFYGYYKVKYKQWIHHPLNFNLLFKWNSFLNNADLVLQEKIDFSNISTSSFKLLPQLHKSFVKNMDSHFNDLDIISIQTKNCSIINHKSKSVIDDSIVSSCISSFEIKHLNNTSCFYINNFMLDYTNLNLQNKNNIIFHHLFHYISKLNINYGIFKYNILPFVNPLCKFNTYTFPVTKWRKPPSKLLHPQFKIIPLSKQNFHLFTNFLKTLNSHFDTIFHANFERIMHLIYNSIWHANLLLLGDQVKAFFFFHIRRKSVLHCFSSANKCENLNDFIFAFKLSFWNIANKNNCNTASIDSISHNNPIIDNIIQKTHPLSVTPFAFYFYNFKKSASVPNHDCLLIL